VESDSEIKPREENDEANDADDQGDD
jgi:hypothetical protein